MDWEALHKKENERIEKLQSELNKQFNKTILISGALAVVFWSMFLYLIYKL